MTKKQIIRLLIALIVFDIGRSQVDKVHGLVHWIALVGLFVGVFSGLVLLGLNDKA